MNHNWAKMDKIEIGGLEVYFMGVRLFSKKLSGVWPHIRLLKEKCKNAYDDYIAGNDISIYET